VITRFPFVSSMRRRISSSKLVMGGRQVGEPHNQKFLSGSRSMPLITCPDCGHHPVSDRAEACPKCGCPIAKPQSGTGQQIPAKSPVVERSPITAGPLEIRLPSKWMVYAANRPSRMVAEYETPGRVNLVPGEIYAFRARIEQQPDLLLLDQLAHVVPLRELMLIDKTRKLGDECLAAVSKFSYLEKLIACGYPSFQGVSFLKNMTALKMIYLVGEEGQPSRVTDEAIMQLSSLTNLEALYLVCTSVTPDGVNRLRQLLPQCEVLGVDDERRPAISRY
jgi:hypothetical protein